MKKIKLNIRELEGGRWIMNLDNETMTALVSMVRLEIGSGWQRENPEIDKAGNLLLEKINKIW